MIDDDLLDVLDILNKMIEATPPAHWKTLERSQALRMISTMRESVSKRRADRLEAQSRVTKEPPRGS